MIRADAPSTTAFWSPARRRRWLLLGGLGLLGASYVELDAWSGRHALLVNASTSLPNWAFLIDRARVPASGDHVFFDPPPSALLERHFGRYHDPFGKIVYGVAGDTVTRQGRLFLVNGRPVALAKPKTMRGEPLALGPVGTIPRGCYFVATPRPPRKMEFVAKTRLHHAAELLRSTNLPIKVIAASIGFQNRSHFSRAFRDAYGSDPSKFRKTITPPELDAPRRLRGSR